MEKIMSKANHTARPGPQQQHREQPWLRADLFFLNHALRHGMSVEEVAGFLGRSTDEVRVQARGLKPGIQLPAISGFEPTGH
jgi:hypothetical protein